MIELSTCSASTGSFAYRTRSGAFSFGSDSHFMTSRTLPPSQYAARNRPTSKSPAAWLQNGSACSLVIWLTKWLARRSAPSNVSAWAIMSHHIWRSAWATPWVSRIQALPTFERLAKVAA
ncbi:hypothetical protein GCM10020295_83830 [Streptomyces cinereospinus]